MQPAPEAVIEGLVNRRQQRGNSPIVHDHFSKTIPKYLNNYCNPESNRIISNSWPSHLPDVSHFSDQRNPPACPWRTTSSDSPSLVEVTTETRSAEAFYKPDSCLSRHQRPPLRWRYLPTGLMTEARGRGVPTIRWRNSAICTRSLWLAPRWVSVPFWRSVYVLFVAMVCRFWSLTASRSYDQNGPSCMPRDDDKEMLLRGYLSFQIPFLVGYPFSIRLQKKKCCSLRA